jgi:hypothetical protein
MAIRQAWADPRVTELDDRTHGDRIIVAVSRFAFQNLGNKIAGISTTCHPEDKRSQSGGVREPGWFVVCYAQFPLVARRVTTMAEALATNPNSSGNSFSGVMPAAYPSQYPIPPKTTWNPFISCHFVYCLVAISGNICPVLLLKEAWTQ